MQITAGKKELLQNTIDCRSKVVRPYQERKNTFPEREFEEPYAKKPRSYPQEPDRAMLFDPFFPCAYYIPLTE